MLNGLKTILAMIVAAYVIPWAAKHSLNVSADDQAQLVAVGVAGVGIVMRFFTSGQALAGIKCVSAQINAWIAERNKPAPVDIMTITDGVVAEIKRRQAAAKEVTK